MDKFSDVIAYLTLPENQRDINEGIGLYAKYYKNQQYLKFLQSKRNHDAVNWKLQKLLRDNRLAIPEIQSTNPDGGNNSVDPSNEAKANIANPDGSDKPIDLSDEVKAYIADQDEAWKAIYKESGADHAVMVDLANSLENGEQSAKLAELAASLDSAFTEKLQKHWNNIEFAKANNAIPKESDEKKEDALDVSALTDVELIKKRGNARSSVSKYEKEGKEELFAKWRSILDALEAEVKRRDLK